MSGYARPKPFGVGDIALAKARAAVRARRRAACSGSSLSCAPTERKKLHRSDHTEELKMTIALVTVAVDGPKVR